MLLPRPLPPDSTWESWGAKFGYHPEVHGFLTSLGFRDSSNTKNAGPSFCHDDLRLELHIGEVEEADRGGACRFTLIERSACMDYMIDMIPSDTWLEIAELLRWWVEPDGSGREEAPP